QQIYTPLGEEHRHGAAVTNFMCHLDTLEGLPETAPHGSNPSPTSSTRPPTCRRRQRRLSIAGAPLWRRGNGWSWGRAARGAGAFSPNVTSQPGRAQVLSNGVGARP